MPLAIRSVLFRHGALGGVIATGFLTSSLTLLWSSAVLGSSTGASEPSVRQDLRSDAVVIEVRAAADRLAAWLANSPYEDAWRQYLCSDDLIEQLRFGDFADRQTVAKILARCSTGAPELSHRHFMALRLALRNWLAHL